VVATPDTRSESFPAIRQSIPLIRERVTAAAESLGATGGQLDAVRLAVSEAVTNVVVHAYRDEPGDLQVSIRPLDDELWVLIGDDGCGCQTPPVAPGMGWGLAIITDSCDEFALVDRAGGGTEARMRFRIPTA
jgi:serine/threonine-protein kinase RsbW